MSEKEIKKRILEEAQGKFLQKGFSHVTMDEIAQDLGMSKKTLYLHFQSKEEMLREMVCCMRDETDSGIASVLENREIDFLEKLVRVFRFLSTQISKHNRSFLEDIHRNAPTVWKEMEDWKRKKVMEDFKRMIDEGMRDKVFRQDINADLVLLLYANALQNVFNPQVLADLPVTSVQAHEMLISFILEGILTNDARHQYASRKHAASAEQAGVADAHL